MTLAFPSLNSRHCHAEPKRLGPPVAWNVEHLASCVFCGSQVGRDFVQLRASAIYFLHAVRIDCPAKTSVCQHWFRMLAWRKEAAVLIKVAVHYVRMSVLHLTKGMGHVGEKVSVGFIIQWQNASLQASGGQIKFILAVILIRIVAISM